LAAVTVALPKPGEVIRYAYLWNSEFAQGHEEGLKDRPCAVIVCLERQDRKVELIVLPITHSSPQSGANAVEMPLATKRRLGLDEAHSWIVLDEANRFVWPGPDIRPFDTPQGASISYGFLPPGLFKIVRDRFLALDAAVLVAGVKRTE
jgi:hypothetical protein